jgi:hypothetical protein
VQLATKFTLSMTYGRGPIGVTGDKLKFVGHFRHAKEKSNLEYGDRKACDS